MNLASDLQTLRDPFLKRVKMLSKRAHLLYWMINLAVAGIYVLLAGTGLLFANHHGVITLWWPSGGFALATLLLGGVRYAPGVFLGAFAASRGFGDPLMVSAVIALGNTLEILFGYWLLTQWVRFDVALSRLRDFLLLVFVAAPLVALIGAACGPAALVSAGIADPSLLASMALRWWMADLLGIMLVAPLILVWYRFPSNWSSPRKLTEAFLILGLAFLAGQVIFLGWFQDTFGGHAKAFMMFVLLSVAAIRLGFHGVSIILLMTAVQALVGASLGLGYFGDDIATTQLSNFWLYMLTLSIIGPTLAIYIGEKNRAVQALQESENRFRTLANNTSVLIWMSGVDSLCNYFNRVWLDFTGRTLAQEMGKGWTEGVHPEDVQSCSEAYLRAFNAREEFNLEYRLRRHDGEYRWILDHGVPRYDDQGMFLGYIGSCLDITERKNAEAAMLDSEIRFRNLLEKIPLVSVQGYSADGTTNYWNQASEYLYGYTAEEAVGKKLTDLIIPPEMHSDVKAAMHKMFETGQPIPAAELRLMRKGGGRVDVFSSHAYVHVPGRPPEMFCMDIDLSERKRDEERIRNLAFNDSLTQLPNRRLLADRVNQALAESNRSGGHGALLFIDLDDFKLLNDTLGHDVGDQLLLQVAQRLIGCVREADTVARLGGDEFVVMLKELSANSKEAAFQAETVCGKILAAMSQPYPLAKSESLITGSIGVALFASNQTGFEELMKRADIAMYQAKKAGRNTFRFFDPEMQSAVEARSALEEGMRRALPDRQFQLYYQMQVDHTGKITGAEALLRWQHPERGMVSPADFIPLAEETGLIVPIGLWALEQACAQLGRWREDVALQHLQLAVNVSARQFRQPDFVDQVIRVMNETRIDPRQLKVELTESLVLENIEDAIAKMKELKQTGIQLSMDDFGTGHSSLSSLRRLPLDQIKIDQSFLRDIISNHDDAIIVQTIIAMARNLGMAVIAEGVETEQQKAFLIQHGCLNFQGYLFGKPISLDEFERLLKNA